MATEYCSLRFLFELTADTHVGDGGAAPLSTLRENAKNLVLDGAPSADPPVATVQRDAWGAPVIEASSLRGALRAHLVGMDEAETATRLFGPETITVDNGGESALFLYAAHAVRWLGGDERPYSWAGDSKDEAKDVVTLLGDLPHADPKTGSFILVGNRLGRHSRTVEDGALYLTEYLPRGLLFACEALFLGDRQAFDIDAMPLFQAMAGAPGIRIGAERGYGVGGLRLQGAVELSQSRYLPESKEWSAGSFATIHIEPEDSQKPFERLVLRCEGPFLILDPNRVAKSVKSENSESEKKEADWLALRRSENEPLLTGKAVIQALRRIAERLELEQRLERSGYDYASLYKALPAAAPKGMPATSLERLFGTSGWAKTLRIERVRRTGDNPLTYKAQSIQLDAFTQGPIDGALMTIAVPCDVTFEVDLALDERRYASRPETLVEDRDFLAALLTRLRQDGNLMLGHGTASGFGWFEIGRERLGE